MYYVTYRNVLRPGKSLDDYRQGLAKVWPTLQSWGATHVEMFHELFDESGAFYTRYSVGSLDSWNEHLVTDEFFTMLRHLEHTLDLSMSEVIVTVGVPSGIS